MFSGEMKGITESSLLAGGGNRVCLSLFNTWSNNTQPAITHKSKSVTVFPPLLRTLLTIFFFDRTAQAAFVSGILLLVAPERATRSYNLTLGLEPRTLVSQPSPLHTGHSLLQRARSLHVYTSASIEVVSDPAVCFNPGKDTVTCGPTFKTLAGSGGRRQKHRRSSVSAIPEVHPHIAEKRCAPHACMAHAAGIGPRRLDGGGFTSRLDRPAVTEALGGDVVLV